MPSDETRPLLPGRCASSSPPPLQPSPQLEHGADNGKTSISSTCPARRRRLLQIPSSVVDAFDAEKRVLLAGFLISLSFSFTQVPLLYAFRLMTCDDFYDKHPPYTGIGDRCARNEIAAGTATQFSLLSLTTTFFGTINVFVAGWTVKRWGPKTAILFQTFVPAVRVLAQIIGIIQGKRAGMAIIQATQIITVFGGPVGYVLVINIIAGEIATPVRRTAVFGMLQGCFMLGQSLGSMTGGMLGDRFGIRIPFDAACCSFLLSCVYLILSLPYMPPLAANATAKSAESAKALPGFFAPLRILAPQRLRLAGGKMTSHYGVILLCAGIFLGVLATDYAPMLIQMYATVAFGFNQAGNGLLMSEFSLVRGIFLLFIFPRIILFGRRLLPRRRAHASDTPQGQEGQGGTDSPTEPRDLDASIRPNPCEESAKSSQTRDCGLDPRFDLIFLRWSLIVDGGFTTVAAFATKPWHMYLAAFLLPLGSGSAPAAKGVITSMCPDSRRADALNAVTLVENVARLATQGLFGFVFAALAQVGQAYATFFCNAAIAVVGMMVLLLSHFPPQGSVVVDASEENNEAEAEEQAIG